MADKCHLCLLGLIILSSLLTGTSGVDETQVFISFGENVHLPCNNDLHDCKSTTWTYNNRFRHSAAVELIGLGIKMKYIERLSLGSDCSLNIKNITKEDYGLYMCRQYVNGQHYQEADTRVYLHVLHVFSSSSQTEISAGSSVTLYCQLFSYAGDSCDDWIRSDGIQLFWVNQAGVKLTISDSRYQISAPGHCIITLTTTLLNEDDNREWRCEVTHIDQVMTSVTYTVKSSAKADSVTAVIPVHITKSTTTTAVTSTRGVCVMLKFSLVFIVLKGGARGLVVDDDDGIVKRVLASTHDVLYLKTTLVSACEADSTNENIVSMGRGKHLKGQHGTLKLLENVPDAESNAPLSSHESLPAHSPAPALARQIPGAVYSPILLQMFHHHPVPKKPKIRGINDYRPVAITSVFAYRANRSVDDAVNMGLHYILQHLDKPGTYARTLFVDFSSAFNTIIPDILQNKLSQLSVPTSICQWITSFLTDRQQLVRLGKLTSGTRTISTGAPQGCILSPLLFSLYTNYCTSKDPSVKLLKFAGQQKESLVCTAQPSGLIHLQSQETGRKHHQRPFSPWTQPVCTSPLRQTA
ncbi:putative RNA-directed DNA polymerase from transposon BS [Labeo rohita]|uniref:RNA-directed DNA polymerase from transposon BS n=1 Tax=Labeo rohita TaxID=84645 RepID=A0ABQ8L8J4_LABRO|nr:putative RNA-directed DNA polymerase from transposon BS [Labeo rohita]